MGDPPERRTLQGWQARGCLVGVALIALLFIVVVVLAVLSNFPRR